MNKWLIGFLAAVMLLTMGPIIAAEDKPKPYLAVFGSAELMDKFWEKYHPDLVMKTTQFEGIDVFLQTVAANAGKRDIVLDFECHGSPTTFMLYLEDRPDGSYDMANMGWLIEKVNRYLGSRNPTVIMESCYSRCVYQRSLKSKFNHEEDDIHIYNWDKPVTFKVMGIGRTVNYNQFVYAQYYYGIYYRIEDLRLSTGKKLSPPLIMTTEEENKMKAVYWMLELYGIAK